MALLQALLSLISRSAGKILNALFGWAVLALFGRRPAREQTLLSAVVAAAALWPLLLVGVAAPKVSALVLAFVPLPRAVPGWIVRAVWIALTVAVPILVGIVFARSSPETGESFARRTARGLPITVALAAAFVFMFVTTPVVRFVSLLRRRRDEHVPLLTTDETYPAVARQAGDLLRAHGFAVAAAEPPWWMSAPSTLLRRLGGRAFRGYVPERIAYLRGSSLEAALHPAGLLLRGAPDHTGWAHALVAEGLAGGPALQTTDPAAQAIEREVHRAWREDAIAVEALGERLARARVPYDDWQVLHRELLQLQLRRSGRRGVMSRAAAEAPSAPAPPPRPRRVRVGALAAVGAALAAVAGAGLYRARRA